MTTIEAHAFHCQPEDSPSPAHITERRRPGRLENPSPELIALMRGNAAQNRAAEEEIAFPVHSTGQLDPLRGLAVALVLSAVIWAVVLRLFF